jgi:hypothetical protein
MIVRSFKLLLAFASTLSPGFSLLENHGQDFYSPKYVLVSKWGLIFDEGGVGLSV